MAKRKRKSTKKQKQGKKRIHLKFELYGLICIAISIIAVLQLGVAGDEPFTGEKAEHVNERLPCYAKLQNRNNRDGDTD